MSKPDTLYLGLCLAGAVSAGAYTAGVMDYLLEALDEWEKRRGEKDVPTHKVAIPAIGGASAGGMTGIITSAMIHEDAHPIREINGDLYREFPKNKLYHSWVDMLQKDMFSLMLDDSDIDKEVHSLLNSDFIDKIAQRAIQVDADKCYLRPYIDPRLKIFTTLTNLKGLSYNTDFIGLNEESAYHFSRHSDFAAFRLNDRNYKDDGWIPLDYHEALNVEIARNAAMATGAFPLGLKARTLQRDARFINDFSWNKPITKHWPIRSEQDRTLCVDGGVINNEPFYKVKNMLEIISDMKAKGREEPTLDEVKQKEREEEGKESEEDMAQKSMHSFSRTTIMIDPFPSVKREEFNADPGLLSVAGHTLKAMLAQVRLKPESLREIYDDDNPNLYLIAPARYEDSNGKETKISGPRALACGFMGGFGGFLHKEFRIHDFFLGRANCEWFLREYFTVPKETRNPIFKNGYSDVKDLAPFLNRKKDRLQIIPIFSPAAKDPYIPEFSSGKNWPVQKKDVLRQYKEPIDRRAESIAANIFGLNWWGKMGYRLFLRGAAGRKVTGILKRELEDWDLIRRNE